MFVAIKDGCMAKLTRLLLKDSLIFLLLTEKSYLNIARLKSLLCLWTKRQMLCTSATNEQAGKT